MPSCRFFFFVEIRNSAVVNILCFVVSLLVPMSMELLLLPGYEVLVSCYCVSHLQHFVVGSNLPLTFRDPVLRPDVRFS